MCVRAEATRQDLRPLGCGLIHVAASLACRILLQRRVVDFHEPEVAVAKCATAVNLRRTLCLSDDGGNLKWEWEWEQEQAQQQQEYDMGRRLMGKGGGAVGPQPVPMRSDMPMAVGGIAALRPMMTSGTFRRPVGTTGTFRDYIS